MSRKERAAKEARELLNSQYQGVLSTLSVDVPGYPFGSVVPYCLDRHGQPVMLISLIAQHTKNIKADPRVSLIVFAGEQDDIQANGRVTYLGNAQKIGADDEDTAQRYYRYFPEARDHHKAHDFDLYSVKLEKVRYIGGFGQIHWVDSELFQLPNPFNHKQETGAVEHMNEDHRDAILSYCDMANITVPHGVQPEMVGVDAEGFHLRLGQRIHRIGFDQPVANGQQMRERLVEMARRARQAA